MAILNGFPPSNTISPGIRLPMCCKCNKVHDWVNVAEFGNGYHICHGCHTDVQEQADFHFVVEPQK